MAALSFWVQDNWFSLLQSVGIVAGLLFTATTMRRDTRARKIDNLLQLAAQHRELWSELPRKPELARILESEVDLVIQPVSKAEEEFLNMVIVYFNTGWQLAQDGSLVTMEAFKTDIRAFFSLPIPRAVWKQKRVFRDPAFARFVEECLAKTKTR